MYHIAAYITALTIFSFACGLFTPASNPDPQPAFVTDAAPAPAAFTPIPTFTPQIPTLAPPEASAPVSNYQLKEERLINQYAVRIWTNPDEQMGFDDIILIEAAGQVPIRVDMFSALHDLTGSDLNGDSYPDVVVETNPAARTAVSARMCTACVQM